MRINTAYILLMLLLVALLPSPARTADGLVINAATAEIRTIGGVADEGWNLWSNGFLGTYIRCEKAGQYTLSVLAHGSIAFNAWPRMGVVVNGEERAAVIVDSPEWKTYEIAVALPAGVSTLTVSFTNDALSGKEDRNLYLKTLLLAGAGLTRATREEWAMDEAKRENATVAQTATAIEKIRKGDATVRVLDALGKPVTGARVTVEQTSHDFLFGCNIYMFDRFNNPEQDALYKQRFADLFNYATVGFYWRSYEWEQGKPNYDYTDRVVEWCRGHDIGMKGHPLLWNYEAGIPRWVKDKPTEEQMRTRVQQIIGRYKGKITRWEVVNEPTHLPGLRIDDPYRWTRAADPDATLIVNDYYVLADGFEPFYNLLKQAQADKVPFDGIGIQAHEPLTMRFPLESVQRILTHYSTLGKPLNITEFTPTSAGQEITGSHVQGVWNEAAQADYAEKFYRVCFAHPAVVAITWWDLCDRGSWQQGGGMLHEDLSPKPVYTALKKLIREEWHTASAGNTDDEGNMHFRGFYGNYRVTVEKDGRRLETTAHVIMDGKNEFSVLLP